MTNIQFCVNEKVPILSGSLFRKPQRFTFAFAQPFRLHRLLSSGLPSISWRAPNIVSSINWVYLAWGTDGSNSNSLTTGTHMQSPTSNGDLSHNICVDRSEYSHLIEDQE